MKTNVIYTDKNFFVNEEKKTVACKLSFKVALDRLHVYNYMAQGDMDYLMKVYNWLDNHPNIKYTDNSNMEFEVTCVAKCSDSDTFNEEFGKHLALTRTQYYAFIVATAMYDMLYNHIEEKYLLPISKLSDGSLNAFVNAEQHIDVLLNKTKTI